jgi:DNA-binding NarL/FixJ family response regulator
VSTVRTVLIATQPLLRAGLRAQLEHDPEVDLVAEAGSLDEIPVTLDSPEAVVCAGEPDLVDAASARWPVARVVVHSGQAPDGSDVLPVLTAREREVLLGAADGLSTRGIAERLGISEHTVKSHLRWAMTKLGASTRTGAVRVAVLRGLL